MESQQTIRLLAQFPLSHLN